MNPPQGTQAAQGRPARFAQDIALIIRQIVAVMHHKEAPASIRFLLNATVTPLNKALDQAELFDAQADILHLETQLVEYKKKLALIAGRIEGV